MHGSRDLPDAKPRVAAPPWPVSLLTAAAIFVSPGVGRGDEIVRLDPQQTRVELALKATLHTAEARLPLRSGEIRLDPATGKASGEIVLDARRAESDSERRDRKMHRDVLESERFPTISFRPAHVAFAPDATRVTLTGVVSIHGSEHPFSFVASVHSEGRQVRARARFDVPYVAWGLEDPSTFVLRVAKVVQVAIEAVGMLSAAE